MDRDVMAQEILSPTANFASHKITVNGQDVWTPARTCGANEELGSSYAVVVEFKVSSAVMMAYNALVTVTITAYHQMSTIYFSITSFMIRFGATSETVL
jgi:hypothetical protein